MSQYFEEVYFDVEKAIELAFDRKYVLNFYEYLKLKGAKKIEVDQFLNSSTAKRLYPLSMNSKSILKEVKTTYIHNCVRHMAIYLNLKQER